MKLVSLLLVCLLSACNDKADFFPAGKAIDRSKPQECDVDTLMLVENCNPVNNPTTSITPVPAPLLNIDLTSSSGPGTVTPSVRINGASWQSLPLTMISPVSESGQCFSLNVRMRVTGAGPGLNGNKYLSASSNQFEVCEDGDNLLVNFNTGEDALYDNATMTISAVGYNLTYTLDANRVIVCLD